MCRTLLQLEQRLPWLDLSLALDAVEAGWDVVERPSHEIGPGLLLADLLPAREARVQMGLEVFHAILLPSDHLDLERVGSHHRLLLVQAGPAPVLVAQEASGVPHVVGVHDRGVVV